MGQNISWHEASVTKRELRQQNGHHSFVLWFTGLSGSGKSTVANAVSRELYNRRISNYVLDGDNVRHGLNKDLGFSGQERQENIRRIGEVAKLFVDSGQVVITAFISPFRSDRELVRELLPEGEFYEVFVDCPVAECEKRDPKGLYQKARQGLIKDFTGIDSPYQVPENPEITLDTAARTIDECVDRVIQYLQTKGAI